MSGLFFITLLFFLPTLVSAATLQLNPSTGSFSSGQTFTVAAQVLPAGKSIKAVDTTMRFDPTLLTVVDLEKDNSVFSLWTVEPTYSNTAGTISFSGSSPALISATSSLVNITFRAVDDGVASVSFTNASIIEAEGQEANIYQNSSPSNFTIVIATVPTLDDALLNQNRDEDISFRGLPRVPEVESASFLEPEVWYRVTEGLFSWKLPPDINAVAVEISTSSENLPNLNDASVYEPPINEFKITDDMVSDGVQYLSLRFENEVDWGITLNRKIQIDSTPPELLVVGIKTDTTKSPFPLLEFKAEDKTSGIAFYELTIADQESFILTPEEAKLGYLLRELEDGTYTVKVVAYDKAGNLIESIQGVLITAGWVKPIASEENKSFFDYLIFINFLLLFLITMITLLIMHIRYEKNQLKIKEDKLRRETRDVHDQMVKIFSALRDEIYEQVNAITKRKRLSMNEKKAVEGLNQALEVSETLIEKEIKDVSAILN